ncbi:MAG: pilus assembly protein, partial [Caulobacteraceae bacterium]|nr:pilus assembly protein [Caulobacteraceae bacterium]
AHAVQQVANDAARAALAGLDGDERDSLARATVATEIADYAYLDPAKASVTTDNLADRMTVTVTYDATDSVFFTLRHLVPMPAPRIARRASVLHGGY